MLRVGPRLPGRAGPTASGEQRVGVLEEALHDLLQRPPGTVGVPAGVAEHDHAHAGIRLEERRGRDALVAAVVADQPSRPCRPNRYQMSPCPGSIPAIWGRSIDRADVSERSRTPFQVPPSIAIPR